MDHPQKLFNKNSKLADFQLISKPSILLLEHKYLKKGDIIINNVTML